MRPHQACPFGAGRGSQPVVRFPLFQKAGPPKNFLFWRNRALFPVASRSNRRCSKAQIASYLAQIRRFLAPTAWASSTSTTKKISPQATLQVLGLFFLGNGWKRAVAVGWNNTMTYPWEEPNLYISPSPWIWKSVPAPAGIAEAHWQAKGMLGSSCHLPQIPLFLKVARQKTTYFGEIGRFFPWPLEAIHAAAKLKLRAIGPK